MALGAILRAERERRGLTEHQVADATKMMVQMVRELEEEDFHRIAAPIYGRGFIKLYAGLLELDPAPLLAEFDRLYAEQGRRQPPPRVALERFGGTPGASIERVVPQGGESVETPSDTRVTRDAAAAEPRPSRPARPATPSPLPVSSAPVKPASDLFGEPLPEPEQPPAAGTTAPAPAPAAAPKTTLPEIPVELAAPSAAPAAKPHKRPPTADATGESAQAAQRTPLPNLIESASQRFEGRPFRPGIGRLIATWLGWLFGLLAAGFAAVGRGFAWIYRSLARLFSRERMGRLVQPLARVNWSRVTRVGLPVVAVLLLVWLGVAVVRLGVRHTQAARAARAELAASDEATMIERILPPPAGYVE